MSRYFVRCLSTSFQEGRNFSECADFRASSSELQSDAVCCLSGNCICIDGGGNRFDLYIHAYAFLLNGFNVTINFIADRMMTSYGNVNQQLSKTTESVSQTLSAVSCRQLVTMAVVLTVFLCFNGILIYSTFRINGRTMKNDCSKGRILDIFSVLFVIIALILTYINTDFL